MMEANECEICSGKVSSFKILPCDHKFCQICINRLNNNQTVRCPTCRRDHTIQSVACLPTLYHGFLKCGNCLVEKPTSDCYWCPVCVQFFCSTCHIDSHSRRMHQVHRWDTLQAVRDCYQYSRDNMGKIGSEVSSESLRKIKELCAGIEMGLIQKLKSMRNGKVPLHWTLEELFGNFQVSPNVVNNLSSGGNADRIGDVSTQIVKMAAGQTQPDSILNTAFGPNSIVEFRITAQSISDAIWKETVLGHEKGKMESLETSAVSPGPDPVAEYKNFLTRGNTSSPSAPPAPPEELASGSIEAQPIPNFLPTATSLQIWDEKAMERLVIDNKNGSKVFDCNQSFLSQVNPDTLVVPESLKFVSWLYTGDGNDFSRYTKIVNNNHERSTVLQIYCPANFSEAETCRSLVATRLWVYTEYQMNEQSQTNLHCFLKQLLSCLPNLAVFSLNVGGNSHSGLEKIFSDLPSSVSAVGVHRFPITPGGILTTVESLVKLSTLEQIDIGYDTKSWRSLLEFLSTLAQAAETKKLVILWKNILET